MVKRFIIIWAGSASFEYFPIEDAIKQKLKKGKNILAIHVANTAGGAYLDAGIVTEPVMKIDAKVINAEQKNVTINATQTIYDFTCGPVDATITFTSPLLIKDLDILSRPVSYVTYSVKSNDGNTHDVATLFWRLYQSCYQHSCTGSGYKNIYSFTIKYFKSGNQRTACFAKERR